MKTAEIRERLLKVLRLAQQGVGGERANAETLLAKLLKKHGWNRQDLERSAEPLEIGWLTARNDEERELLKGLINSICGRGRMSWLDRKKRTAFGFEATRGEHIAVALAWEVIVPAWQKARGDLLLAFAWRNGLYDASQRETEDEEPLSEAEKARAKRAAALVGSLEHVERPVPRISPGLL